MGNIDRARAQLHAAAACEPYNREWLYRLGGLHFNCQEWQTSLAYLRAALELPIDNRSGWHETSGAQILELINYCQQNIAHALAHSPAH